MVVHYDISILTRDAPIRIFILSASYLCVDILKKTKVMGFKKLWGSELRQPFYQKSKNLSKQMI